MKWDRNAFPELFVTVFRYIVLTLMALFVSYLALLSLFGTNFCVAGKNYFLSDSPYKTIAVYVALIVLGCVLKRRKLPSLQSRSALMVRPILLVALFIVLVIFVNGLKLLPYGDQLAISNAAREFRYYDFSQFMMGNYLSYFPFQSRVVVFLMGLWSLTGDSNHTIFALLNVLSVIAVIVLTAKTFEKTGLIKELSHKTMITAALILFWPLLFYVTFVYGNLIGLAAMMAAFWFLVSFLEAHSVRHLIGMAVFCGIGIWLKNSYMILMVAMLVILCVDWIHSRKAIKLGAMLAILVCTYGVSALSDVWLSRYMGMPLPEGSPMIS
ncbi:MAG: glycosyltransferase family 39 protein [Lachnospiraceae bacterium]|nr:glycosyltransferase family 39 protein [Lachnospiraceae bacterium]